MPTDKKKTAATRVPSAPAKKTRRKKPIRRQRRGPGVTSEMAKRNLKRYGRPLDRLRARVALEAKMEPTPLDPNDKLLRLREAAERIGIAEWTLRSWALSGKCIFRRIGNLLLMIPETEVERLRSYGN